MDSGIESKGNGVTRIDDTIGYEYHNVKLKAFENESKEITRSFKVAKNWVNSGRNVAAYIHIPHVGERCTSNIIKIRGTFSGWKVQTSRHNNTYIIKSVQKPIKVVDVLWYIGDKVVENEYDEVMKAISLEPDVVVKAEVTYRNGNFHTTSRVISIMWEEGIFETENHSRYRFKL